MKTKKSVIKTLKVIIFICSFIFVILQFEKYPPCIIDYLEKNYNIILLKQFEDLLKIISSGALTSSIITLIAYYKECKEVESQDILKFIKICNSIIYQFKKLDHLFYTEAPNVYIQNYLKQYESSRKISKELDDLKKKEKNYQTISQEKILRRNLEPYNKAKKELIDWWEKYPDKYHYWKNYDEQLENLRNKYSKKIKKIMNQYIKLSELDLTELYNIYIDFVGDTSVENYENAYVSCIYNYINNEIKSMKYYSLGFERYFESIETSNLYEQMYDIDEAQQEILYIYEELDVTILAYNSFEYVITYLLNRLSKASAIGNVPFSTENNPEAYIILDSTLQHDKFDENQSAAALKKLRGYIPSVKL